MSAELSLNEIETPAAPEAAPPPEAPRPAKFHGRHERTTRTKAQSLRGWRLRHNLDQREAAKILGLSQSAYARFELQTRYPRPKVAKRMRIITGLSLEIILGID
jgi:DNA-binding XRE family transcriptional regulator